MCLWTILAFEDESLTAQEKQLVMLRNLYIDEPANLQAAIEKANWFLNGGEDVGEEGGSNLRLYSFSKDANFIFAAFRQTHNIDLETAELHWWKFLAFFMDLGQDTTFCNLTSLRSRYYTGKCTKEEKESIRKMGSMFHIKESETLTPEDRERRKAFVEKHKAAKEKRDKARAK